MTAEADVDLTCVECAAVFTWTEGERKFFKAKGLQQPKRCTACRRERKAAAALPRSNDWRRDEQRGEA